jgi:hypothetical protein
MADREHDIEEGNEALDPELLYSKEYCIGQSLQACVVRHICHEQKINIAQVVAVLAKFTKGTNDNLLRHCKSRLTR